LQIYSSFFSILFSNSSQTVFGIFFAIFTSGYFLAAKKGHLREFLIIISSQVSASIRSHCSLTICSKSSSFFDTIFQIRLTSGYFELARNGPNLPVFTTIVPSIPSGQGFHSYLFLNACNLSDSSLGCSI